MSMGKLRRRKLTQNPGRIYVVVPMPLGEAVRELCDRLNVTMSFLVEAALLDYVAQKRRSKAVVFQKAGRGKADGHGGGDEVLEGD